MVFAMQYIRSFIVFMTVKLEQRKISFSPNYHLSTNLNITYCTTAKNNSLSKLVCQFYYREKVSLELIKDKEFSLAPPTKLFK